MQGPVAAWVEQEASWTGLSHLMLGAPLNLYAACEYRGLYWYCDYLLACAQQAFNELEMCKPPIKKAAMRAVQGKRRIKGDKGRPQLEHTGQQATGLEARRTAKVGVYTLLLQIFNPFINQQ